MTRVTRREFLAASGTGLGLLATGCAPALKGDFAPKTGRRVVVIGGGWGGATAAKYVRLADPSVEVVLLEPGRRFVSCPFSNLVLSGVRTIDSLTFGYGGLRKQGVRVLHETATAIEPDARRVRVGEGYLQYDRLIVSPGVEFQTEQVEGLAEAGDQVLHAWKAGPQTVMLAERLRAMPEGGVFVLTVPPVAYRCPPGPYERVCQVAWYLKNAKPRAKLIVLDANQNVVSKTALFRAAWQAYPNLEYRASNKVVKVDPGVRQVTTEFGDTANASLAGAQESAEDPYAHFNATVGAVTKGAYDGPMARLGAGPERVAAAIEKAITRSRPPARVVITPSARITLATRRLLSDRAWDAAMRRQFPQPGAGS